MAATTGSCGNETGVFMNLEIWMPLLFGLGIVSMGLCFLFLKACEKI
jgi:hypothetical protein